MFFRAIQAERRTIWEAVSLVVVHILEKAELIVEEHQILEQKELSQELVELSRSDCVIVKA